MADKAISDLTQATQLGDNDLFVLEQNGTAKKMLMSLWKGYIDRNVVSTSATQLPAGSQPTATFNPANGSLALGIPKGDKGEPGASSAGYVSGIVKGDGVGNVSAATPNVDYTEPWVSTKPYAAGAYCVHDGYLWHNTSAAASTGVEPGTNYNVWNVTYSNENLLDNPWFTVNQRGVSSWTSGYGVDRWFSLTDTGAEITENGIKGHGGYCCIQPLEQSLWDGLLGKTVTLSVLLADGTLYSATGSFGSGSPLVRNPDVDFYPWTPRQISGAISDGVIVRAVKLELGSVSTLANDTAPNYDDELIKCQRYLRPYLLGSWSDVDKRVDLTEGGTRIEDFLDFSANKMRTRPSILCYVDGNIRIVGYTSDGTLRVSEPLASDFHVRTGGSAPDGSYVVVNLDNVNMSDVDIVWRPVAVDALYHSDVKVFLTAEL